MKTSQNTQPSTPNSQTSTLHSPLIPPGYKQTELGVIPEEWDVKLLGQLSEFVTSGSRGWARHYSDRGPLFVRSQNIRDGLLDFTDRQCVIPPAGSEGIRTRLNRSDLLITITGNSVGNVAWVEHDIGEAYISQHVGLVRLLEPSFAEYVCLFLAPGSPGNRQIWASQAGQSKPGLNLKNLEDFWVALPPGSEQRAIAEALSDADALIESLEQLLTKKRHLKQGAMQELLTGKKRLPGYSGEWSKRQLGEVIDTCSSGATPYRGNPEYYKGTVKWITSGELNHNLIPDTIEHISEEAVEKTNLKVHPIGTFLMAITGLEAAGTRGACGMVGSPATTNQSCMAIYPTLELKTEFLYHYYVLRGNELALTYCQGTKQQSYTAKLVRLLPIDLPPTGAEQTAIAAILSDMDTEIAALEAKLTKARQLKQGMMQELLTGRIRLINVRRDADG